MPSELPYWYYNKKDLKNTPSFQDGIDNDTEARYRQEGGRFIINMGTTLGFLYDTIATGGVYFHRFYMFHSFKDFPRYVTGCCCLFLAGKVEETPKKCHQIIDAARSLLTEDQFNQFGTNPKDEVKTLEKILLQTIKFDLQVEHPYGYLLKYTKQLKGDKQKLHKMLQMAWTFVNDSLCTTLSLQWESEIIAIALMHLGGKLTKFEIVDWHGRTPKHNKWWDLFVEDITVELLEDICHQVLDVYSDSPGNNGTLKPNSSPTPPLPLTKPPLQPPQNQSNFNVDAYTPNPFNYFHPSNPQTPPDQPNQTLETSKTKCENQRTTKKMRLNSESVPPIPQTMPQPYPYIPPDTYQFSNPPPPHPPNYPPPGLPPMPIHGEAHFPVQFQGNFNSGYHNYQQPIPGQVYYNVPPPSLPYQAYQETYPPGTNVPSLQPNYQMPSNYTYPMGQYEDNAMQGRNMQNW